MDKNEQNIIDQTIEQFLNQLGIEGGFETTVRDDSLDVMLDTADTGIVIGYHGETLDALQLILSLIIAKKLDRFLRVSIEVGDYKKNRTSYLEHLAQQAKERAIAEQHEQVLPSLKAWERRIVHMFLQNDDAVTSESTGEGKDRALVIRPKAQ